MYGRTTCALLYYLKSLNVRLGPRLKLKLFLPQGAHFKLSPLALALAMSTYSSALHPTQIRITLTVLLLP